VARQGRRGDVVVRGIPDRCPATENDDLRGLVPDAGAGGDLLRQGALRPHVQDEGGKIRPLAQEGFDLVQGR